MEVLDRINSTMSRPTALELADETAVMADLMVLSDNEIRNNKDFILEAVDCLWDAHLEGSFQVEGHSEKICQEFSKWLVGKLYMLGIALDEIDKTASLFLVTRSDYIQQPKTPRSDDPGQRR